MISLFLEGFAFGLGFAAAVGLTSILTLILFFWIDPDR